MITSLQAIVFDFDGVIADSEPLHLRAFQQILAEERIELSAADYYSRYLGYDDVGLFQALAADRAVTMTDRQVTELVARKGVRLQQMLHDDVRAIADRLGCDVHRQGEITVNISHRPGEANGVIALCRWAGNLQP